MCVCLLVALQVCPCACSVPKKLKRPSAVLGMPVLSPEVMTTKHRSARRWRRPGSLQRTSGSWLGQCLKGSRSGQLSFKAVSSAGLAHRDEEDQNLILKRLLWPQLREAATSDCSSDFSKAAASRLRRLQPQYCGGFTAAASTGWRNGRAPPVRVQSLRL